VNIKEFFRQCKRVLMVASKPDKEEYKMSLKITTIGVVIIGIVAFIIFILFRLIGGA